VEVNRSSDMNAIISMSVTRALLYLGCPYRPQLHILMRSHTLYMVGEAKLDLFSKPMLHGGPRRVHGGLGKHKNRAHHAVVAIPRSIDIFVQ